MIPNQKEPTYTHKLRLMQINASSEEKLSKSMQYQESIQYSPCKKTQLKAFSTLNSNSNIQSRKDSFPGIGQ